MVVVTKTNLLTVGIGNKVGLLKKLPVNVVNLRFGSEAVRSLKIENFNGVISRWQLEDMEDGNFLKALKTVKSNIPTIAVIEQGNWMEEISARSLGVSAILSEESSNEYFLRTVSAVLKLPNSDSIQTIYAVEDI